MLPTSLLTLLLPTLRPSLAPFLESHLCSIRRSFSKQAIRVMDLATLDPIAPDPLITDAGAGVYWSLTYDRGVRLRVMPIDSDAGWSGLFFD